MKVWIDQDSCVGSMHCVKRAPQVFAMKDDKAYVLQNGAILGEGGPDALASVPAGMDDAVLDSIEQCEGGCIFIEAD